MNHLGGPGQAVLDSVPPGGPPPPALRAPAPRKSLRGPSPRRHASTTSEVFHNRQPQDTSPEGEIGGGGARSVLSQVRTWRVGIGWLRNCCAWASGPVRTR